MKYSIRTISFLLLIFYIGYPVYCQPSDYRPELIFREDWKEIPAEIPVNQGHVENSNLILHLYGPGKDVIKKSHHDQPADDPYYIWSGLCEGNWMVTLEHKELMVDLTGYAKIRWRTKQAGLRALHLVVKTADGVWLVSQESDGPSSDWRVSELILMNLHWFELDGETICEKKLVTAPDLSRVLEIGFTDLMRGGVSAACSRLDWIEVYGEKVRK